MYAFTWPTPAFGGLLGACHAVDIPFAFHNLDAVGVDQLTGDSPERAAVADAYTAAILAFARTGDPGWPAWAPPRRAVRRFDVRSEVLDDPEAGLRELWARR